MMAFRLNYSAEAYIIFVSMSQVERFFGVGSMVLAVLIGKIRYIIRYILMIRVCMLLKPNFDDK